MFRLRENMRNSVFVGTELAKQTTLGWWFSAGLGLASSRPCPSMILEFPLAFLPCGAGEVVELLTETNAEDWLVAGPRTPSWCAIFLNRRSGPA